MHTICVCVFCVFFLFTHADIFKLAAVRYFQMADLNDFKLSL